jgi:preprotein translocase subunit SecA
LGGNIEAELSALDNPSESEVQKRREAWKQRHQQVLDAGGLHILGTERHESRRVDNQLRGRAGRQGDPGVTRFYLSLEDDLMRIFASDRVRGIMQALGMEEGEPIEHRMVNNAIEKAQKKVEGRNFDIRKSLLEFDDVANEQRQVVYKQRDDILTIDDMSELIASIRQDVAVGVFRSFVPEQSLDDMWDISGLEKTLENDFSLTLSIHQWLKDDERMTEDAILEKIQAAFNDHYKDKADLIGDEIHRFEKHVMLQVLDGLWKEHLAMMDHLRMGIHLRGYAGKNPKQEYKRESFELFQEMLENMKYDLTSFLMQVRVRTDEEIKEAEESMRLEHERAQALAKSHHAESGGLSQGADLEGQPQEPVKPFVREGKKVGRNEPCPCGSGKKYKQCHGRVQ